ncbi:MerR family transcriptional regulator [Kitasatospora azatica]|uniref:MerR family transcriptional regulator n=1 Tax=Kitasatospora azatica TaxID=58347 RepID=UPI0018DB115C|nr:MerR family transcriptional regulator [Kitasatospora azatica]
MDLSIGQVAERTGLSVHALRFYEKEGVLAGPVRRRAGGQRVYSEHDVDWLHLCVVLRGSGMPLPEIRRYTELARTGSGTEPDRIALLREHQTRVEAQLTELGRCLDLIKHKVAVYEDLLDQRPVDHLCNP